MLTRAIVVATGARYRKLDVSNNTQYDNRGLYYAATAMEAALCRDREVIVVGGGNSAGQAAAAVRKSLGASPPCKTAPMVLGNARPPNDIYGRHRKSHFSEETLGRTIALGGGKISNDFCQLLAACQLLVLSGEDRQNEGI